MNDAFVWMDDRPRRAAPMAPRRPAEVEVLRALGYEPTLRSLVRRRAELLSFLRSALLVEPDRSPRQ